MSRSRLWSVVTAGVVSVPLLALLGPAPADAAPVGACEGDVPAGQVRYRWNGNADDNQWKTDDNWSVTGPGGTPLPARAPNYIGTEATDDSLTGLVCIAPDVPTTIALDDEVNPHVVAIEVAGNVTLDASVNARLWVYGDAAQYQSRFHAGSVFNHRGGVLGGPGTILMDGFLRWGQLGSPVTSLDHDLCPELTALGQAVDACAGVSPATRTGVLRIGATGEVLVDGRGVNLDDGYRLEVASGGELRIAGQGYVAADRDTEISVEDGGLLDLAGDGSIFEGNPNGQPAADLAELDNLGTVRKSLGAGRSSLNVLFSGAGAVEVQQGGLSIAGGTPVTADVAAGARLGTGTCGDAGPAVLATQACTPETSATDLQFAVISPQSSAADISLEERLTTEPGGDLQPAVEVQTATPDVPSTIDLQFDDAIPDRPTRPEIAIFHRRPGLAPHRIPLCGSGGRMPASTTSCLIGRRTTAAGAVQVRVRSLRPAGLFSLRPSGVDFVRLVTPLVGSRPGCQVMHPTYPHVSTQPVRLRRAGPYVVRFATTENTSGGGTAILRRSGVQGRNDAPLTIRRTGWVAATAYDAEGNLESSGAFRVVATPTVRFLDRSRTSSVGRTIQVRGVVKPGGRRSLRLYVVRVTGTSGYLRATTVVTRTDAGGRFTVRYRPSRAGRFVFAVNVVGTAGLSTAMSRQAVKVRVTAPTKVAPPPTVVRPFDATERTTTGSTGVQNDLLDQLTAFHLGRAGACRFRVRY